jgi:hypothetical protein
MFSLPCWVRMGRNFSNPIYYVTLAVAAWCLVSKLMVYEFGVGGRQCAATARISSASDGYCDFIT